MINGLERAFIRDSFNGRTQAFGACYVGSNPTSRLTMCDTVLSTDATKANYSLLG